MVIDLGSAGSAAWILRCVSVLVRIRAVAPSLRPAQRRVAEAVLRDPAGSDRQHAGRGRPGGPRESAPRTRAARASSPACWRSVGPLRDPAQPRQTLNNTSTPPDVMTLGVTGAARQGAQGASRFSSLGREWHNRIRDHNAKGQCLVGLPDSSERPSGEGRPWPSQGFRCRQAMRWIGSTAQRSAPDAGPIGYAQFALEHLAGAGFRQRVDQLDGARTLVAGNPLPAEGPQARFL
jgi:hypothetical protein